MPTSQYPPCRFTVLVRSTLILPNNIISIRYNVLPNDDLYLYLYSSAPVDVISTVIKLLPIKQNTNNIILYVN